MNKTLLCKLLTICMLSASGATVPMSGALPHWFSQAKAAAFKHLPRLAQKGSAWSRTTPALTALGTYAYGKYQQHDWNKKPASEVDPEVHEQCARLTTAPVRFKKLHPSIKKTALGISYPRPTVYLKEVDYHDITNKVALLAEVHHSTTAREAKVVGSIPACWMGIQGAKKAVKTLALYVKTIPKPSTLPLLLGQCALTKLAGNAQGIGTLLGALWYKKKLDTEAYDHVLSQLSLDELKSLKQQLITQDNQDKKPSFSPFDYALAVNKHSVHTQIDKHIQAKQATGQN